MAAFHSPIHHLINRIMYANASDAFSHSFFFFLFFFSLSQCACVSAEPARRMRVTPAHLHRLSDANDKCLIFTLTLLCPLQLKVFLHPILSGRKQPLLSGFVH